MTNNSVMKKSCNCGGTMTIHMHTLIHRLRVKITNVPVYTCEVCARYEPLPYIVRDLSALIGELGENPARARLSFADRNEWAFVLKGILSDYMYGDVSELEEMIHQALQNRIDMLLDIYRFASDSGDEAWMKDTAHRLSQLTAESPEVAK